MNIMMVIIIIESILDSLLFNVTVLLLSSLLFYYKFGPQMQKFHQLLDLLELAVFLFVVNLSLQLSATVNEFRGKAFVLNQGH